MDREPLLDERRMFLDQPDQGRPNRFRIAQSVANQIERVAGRDEAKAALHRGDIMNPRQKRIRLDPGKELRFKKGGRLPADLGRSLFRKKS